jgi:hypothetical protein
MLPGTVGCEIAPKRELGPEALQLEINRSIFARCFQGRARAWLKPILSYYGLL